MALRNIAVWGILFCLYSLSGLAQEKASTEQPEGLLGADLPFKISAPYFKNQPEGKDQVVLASGNVHAWQGKRQNPEFELDCQSLVIWRTRMVTLNKITGKPQVSWRTEFYAEKEVRFARQGEILFAHAMYFDLDANKGLIIDVRYETEALFGKKLVPLIMRANRYRIHNRIKSTARNAYLTTCSFGDPHYRFQTSHVLILRQPKVGQQDDFEMWVTNNVIKVGVVPIFYIPKLYVSRVEDFPLKRVETGTSGRFGRFVYTQWGQRIGRWGRWILDVDHRSTRGPAIGPGVIYSSTDAWENEYEGRLISYFLRDDLPGGDTEEGATSDADFGTDAPRESALIQRGRYRVRGRHRHNFPDKLRLDLEISKISDRNLLPEFFERELREDKPQETIAYLRKQLDNHQATLLIKTELTDFSTSTEYLPQLTWDSIAEPVHDDHWFFRRMYWTTHSQLAFLRRHIDQDLNDPDDGRTQVRADSQHELNYPFKIGFVRFNPFLGARLGFFSKPLSGGDIRVAGAAGVRVNSEFHRLYDMHFPLLRINKLMHVITPEISYTTNYFVDPEPDELFFYDDIDTVGEVGVFRFKLMNRLKTRRFSLPAHKRFGYPRKRDDYIEPLVFGRHLKRQGRVIELLYFDMELPVFPDSSDNFGRTIGDLDIESILRLRSWLVFTADAEVRLESGDGGQLDKAGLRVMTVGLGISKPEDTYPRWRIFLGNRFARDISNTVILETSISVNPKWEITAGFQFDTRLDVFQSQRLTIRRYFHRLAVDLTFDRDEGEQGGKGNTTVKFGVNLRGFAETAAFTEQRESERRNQPAFKYLERLVGRSKARQSAKSEAEQQPAETEK